jgi:pimeloyl-ACP methyl ester carboxylesterase
MRTFPAVLLLGLAASAISSATVAANERSDGFVNAGDGARLYYVEKGTGPDVLVAPVALYLEPHLLDELAAKRRVIFYDPRNRGRSDAADVSSVSLDRQIEDLEALRKALGIEKMALLGWSGLGMEMAVYALRYPQHVTRLIQMSAVPPAASIMQEFGDSRGDRVDQTALDDLYRRADAGEFDNKPQEYCRRVNALTDPGNFADTDLAKHVPDVCVYENEWPKNLWPYFGALLPSFGDYDCRDPIPPDNDEFGFILDIDVFTRDAFECSDEILREHLPKMRLLKDEAFFSLIKPRAINSFRMERK